MKISELSNTIGISREQLPQIDFDYLDDILDKLSDENVEVRTGTVPAADLTPSQDKLNNEKVQSIVDQGTWNDDRKLFISKDGFIVDGHHYWAANMLKEPGRRIPVFLVGMNIIDLINWFNSTEYVENKTITEGKRNGKLSR